jgi:[glutamine synthetase] adenylyltransferase / [glutamine synthetase]-adenylyl-L-tyrosine phosphorylase
VLVSRIHDEIERSADPVGAALVLERVARSNPDAGDRIDADPSLASAVIAVAAASPWLGRVCATEPGALDVLADLDGTHSGAEPGLAVESAGSYGALSPGAGLARAKRLGVLRIAARDLLGLDTVEDVGSRLAQLASSLLQQTWDLTLDPGLPPDGGGLAVIGMGKLGGGELNYSSDVDVLLVSPSSSGPGIAPDPRTFLDLARRAWRVDLDLRPEGRAGPLTRSLASYQAYWDRWAETWEFQSLLKARAVAGNATLGSAFGQEAASRVWGRPFGSDDLRQVRRLKGRAEQAVKRQGLADRELKRGKGGIRDIEFAVQLLQLVHGRTDPSLRSPATVAALWALAAGGYIAPEDATTLAAAYDFLRTVEHRLQLYEDLQVHTLPQQHEALVRLARVLGYRDELSASAVSQFEFELRRHRTNVRWIHERLFFRPLLESFTSSATPADTQLLTSEAVVDRLQAFGFTDADRTFQAVRELTRGFSRTSQLMTQMLPMLLDWLSAASNPDVGLLGLRTLATGTHRRDQLTALCRESPEAARRLCQLLGTGPSFTRAFQRQPDLLAGLATGETLADHSRAELDDRAFRSLTWRSGEGAVEQGLRRFTNSETLRISARDVLEFADVDATGAALADLAESVVDAALRIVDPPFPFAVIGMGRLGGRELAYSSDLDLLFVYEAPDGWAPAAAAAQAEASAMSLVRLLSGVTPATGLYRIDTALRPEGRQGPQARSLDAYAAYYQRWAQVWERQALLRGRTIAGDAGLRRRFEYLAGEFVWNHGFGPFEIREIRRTKARIERERVPPSDDPKFHLKLGPGSLSDIEWTAQLLQLQHGVRETGTVAALDVLVRRGVIATEDHRVLVEAYRFCAHTRNRLALVRDGTVDSLPTPGSQLTALARSLGTTGSGLRDEYQRRTRRARRVVERLFYGNGE